MPPCELRLFGGRNPRQGDVDAIAASLRRHSQYAPITANIGTHTGRAHEIIKGNHTTLAFRQLAEQEPDDPRWRKILVHWVDVDDDMATRIMTADNRTGQLGGFDNDVLAELLKGFGDDLDGLGYTEADVATLVALNENNGGLPGGDQTPVSDPAPKPQPQKRYDGDQFVLHHGDCLDVLKTLAANSVDAVVTDPPYGIGFMGKEWDHKAIRELVEIKGANHDFPKDRGRTQSAFNNLGIKAGPTTGGMPFQEWCQQWATECLRVLRPGGHMLVFGGTRTWHRMVVGIEDAGFEIRDSIAWLYGSGFPKSLDVSKAIDKAAGAERERIPRVGGALNAGTANGWSGSSPDSLTAPLAGTQQVDTPVTDAAKRWQGWGTALKPAFEPVVVARKPLDVQTGTVAGNVLACGTGALNIDACRVGTETVVSRPGNPGANSVRLSGGDGRDADNARRYAESGKLREPTTASGRWPANVVLDEHAAAELDEQSGDRPGMKRGELKRGATTGRSIGGDSAFGTAEPQTVIAGYGDSGGASRFFYTAKAAPSERPRDENDGTAHPTVKPVELMRWLIRLVTPPGGVVLEPFAGSGTTVEACLL